MSNKIETPTINKYNVTPKFRKAKVGSDHDYICTVNSIESNSDIFFCGTKFLEEICLNHKDRLIKLVINDIKYVNTYNVEDKCKSIVYYVKNGIIHNLNGPATIGKFFDLSSQKEYYVNGFYIGLEGEPNVETSFKQEVKDYLKLNPKEREAFTTLKKNMTNKPAAKKPAAKKPAVANKSKTPILDSLCSNYKFNTSTEKGCDYELIIKDFRISKYHDSDYALSNLNKEICCAYPGKNIKVIYSSLIGDVEPKRVSIVEYFCDGEYHNAYGPAIYSVDKYGNRFDGYYYDHGKEIGYCDRDEFPINGITSIIEDYGYRVIYTSNSTKNKDYDVLCEVKRLNFNKHDYLPELLDMEICRDFKDKRIKVIYSDIINDHITERIMIVEYLYNGKTHRENGPAVYSVNNSYKRFGGAYYKNGRHIAICDNDKYPIEDKHTTVKTFSDKKYIEYIINTNDIKYIEKEIKRINNLKSNKDKTVYIKTKNVNYTFFNGKLHNDKEAAIEIKDNSGKIISEEYYLDGKKVYFYNYKINKEPKKIKTKMNKEKLLYYEVTETIKNYTGGKRISRYLSKDNMILHNPDGPAVIELRGSSITEEYFLNGKPAYYYNNLIVESNKDNNQNKGHHKKVDTINCIAYYDHMGFEHNTGSPAVMYKTGIDHPYAGNEFWKKHGRYHRENGPAIIKPIRSSTTEEYFIDGVTYSKEEYYKKMNKKEEDIDYYEEENSDYIIRYKNETKTMHCTTGPAVEYRGRDRKEWFVNGRLHRLDGPAVVEKYKDLPDTKLYFINGYSFSEPNYYAKLREMGLATIGSDEEMQNKQLVKTPSGSETLNAVSEEKTTSTNIATEKVQEDNKKPMANKEYKLFDADRWLAESKKAGIRVTANQITDFVSGALVGFIAKQFGDTPEIRLYAETVIKTKAGKALVSTVAGNVIPMIEQLNGNETATILAEEFRIQAMETIGNQLMSFVMAELVPGIAGIVSAIPAQIAPTSIQKEASGVKQLRVEHPEQAVEEESNVVPIAVKNAL